MRHLGGGLGALFGAADDAIATPHVEDTQSEEGDAHNHEYDVRHDLYHSSRFWPLRWREPRRPGRRAPRRRPAPPARAPGRDTGRGRTGRRAAHAREPAAPRRPPAARRTPPARWGAAAR